jgi:hypothetical protein
MNPFSPRSVAARRDADHEDEARRDMEAFERNKARERIADMVRALAGPLADLYEAGEAVYRIGGDNALDLAMGAMEQERKRRHEAHVAEIEAKRLIAQPPSQKLASDHYAAVMRARPATPDAKEPDHG